MTPTFTPAQLLALRWLNPDGGWHTAPRHVGKAVASFCLRYSDLAKRESRFGYMHYKLTPAGIAERAKHFGEVG